MNKDFFPEDVKPGMISPMDTEKMLYILNNQQNCCCKITVKAEKAGTGFFCKIILPETLKILPVLMTCNHVLDEEDIKIGKIITYSLDNDKYKFAVIVDDSRLIYTNSKMDYTIIQLRKNEYPDIYSFLSIEEEIFKEQSINDLVRKSIYLLHYPKGDKANISLGTIKAITEDKGEIFHNCGSETGSSGGPLINLLNMKLIGIHKGYKSNKNFNSGNFIKPIIEDFFKNIDLKKIKFEDNLKNKNVPEDKIKDKTELKKQPINNANEEIRKSLEEENNFIYYLVFILSYFKQIYIGLLFSFIFSNPPKNDDIIFIFFVLLLLDIIFGIILSIIKLFLNDRILLLISIFTPVISLKIMISSFFQVIPFFDDRIIKEMIKGEIIAHIICILVYYQIPLVFRQIITVLTIIMFVICIILIIKNFIKQS